MRDGPAVQEGGCRCKQRAEFHPNFSSSCRWRWLADKPGLHALSRHYTPCHQLRAAAWHRKCVSQSPLLPCPTCSPARTGTRAATLPNTLQISELADESDDGNSHNRSCPPL
eukprot:m.69573 g.69573  ORF g.69573 m.69573 type:complete len:112 (-) comp7826_c1_seq1:1220-1555(-)